MNLFYTLDEKAFNREQKIDEEIVRLSAPLNMKNTEEFLEGFCEYLKDTMSSNLKNKNTIVEKNQKFIFNNLMELCPIPQELHFMWLKQYDNMDSVLKENPHFELSIQLETVIVNNCTFVTDPLIYKINADNVPLEVGKLKLKIGAPPTVTWRAGPRWRQSLRS